jgi:hypothetical protein
MNIQKIIKDSGAEHFITMVKNKLKKYNGKILFKNTDIVHRDIDGEFSEFDMTIKCYIDPSSNYWVGVLAHEYSHFRQSITESPYWTNFQNEVAEVDDFDKIFKNKKTKLSTAKAKRLKIIYHVVRMELDCDKSAIKLINKYKLPVDKNEYRAKANIVLYKYLYWAEYGIWPNIISKKTNKTVDWRELKLNRLLGEEKYSCADDIPRKLFYIFQDNNL